MWQNVWIQFKALGRAVLLLGPLKCMSFHTWQGFMKLLEAFWWPVSWATYHLRRTCMLAGVYRLKYTGWSIQAEVCRLKYAGWSMQAEIYRLKYAGWSIQAEVCRLKYTGWSMQAGVCRLEYAGWSGKWMRISGHTTSCVLLYWRISSVSRCFSSANTASRCA